MSTSKKKSSSEVVLKTAAKEIPIKTSVEVFIRTKYDSHMVVFPGSLLLKTRSGNFTKFTG